MNSRYFNFFNIIFVLFLVAILVMSLAIPVFATEVEGGTIVVDPETGLEVLVFDGETFDTEPIDGEGVESSETTEYVEPEPTTLPENEPDSEPSLPPVVDVSQGSIDKIVEGVSGSQSSTEPSEPLKVDLTDNSISAIADAVVLASDIPFLVNKQGIEVSLYGDVPDRWDDYNYHLIGRGGNGLSFYFFSNSPIIFKNNYFYMSGILGHGNPSNNTVSWSNISSYASGYAGLSYTYSDHNILDGSGNLIYASDVSVSYTISFDTGFEDLVLDSVSSNSFTVPILSYEGYQFDGWYLDSDYSLVYSSDYVFVSDTTLYAKWTPYRTISFVTNIEGYELSSVTVLSGSTYFCPSFVYEAYEFVGAFTDENFENPFVDGTEITEDTVLYLNFSEIQYDIGGLVSQLLGVARGLDVIESQLWIILTVGLMYFVYKFFRIFF